jgi:hypothetical protein
MSYPSDIHVAYTLLDNTDDVLAVHPNTLSSEIRALETKVGIDSSAVNTTIDYFLKHASGAYRGHLHDGSSDDGAQLDWDTCWSDAVHTHASAAEGGQVALTTAVTGVLPIANGGTNSSSAANTANGVVILTAAGKYPAVDGSLITGTVSNIVQIVNTPSGATNTGTTVMPYDDTIPQNTEGDEYITRAITPTSATNKLKIDVVINGSASANYQITAALFRDTTANALACGSMYPGNNDTLGQIVFSHYMDAGTTSATTFKIRVGLSNAGTYYYNGTAAGRRFGGVLASSITITEIKV